MTQTLSDYDITEAMIVFGGRFVSALAHCYRLADAGNQRRLKRAFPELWQQYADPLMHERLQAAWSKATDEQAERNSDGR